MTRVVAIALLLAGCAASSPPRENSPRPPQPPPPDGQDFERTYVDLRRFDSQLQHVDTQAAAPDCGQIAQLRDAICALTARICQIAASDSSPTIATERCTDGKARCKAAIERADARGCPPMK